MEFIRHAHVLAQEAHEGIFRDILLPFRHHHHLDAGRNQECAEQVKHPAIFLHQRRTRRNHDAAQHDHADDAPNQRAILVAARDGEIAKDQADHEDIVDGQRLFDEKAGEIGNARMGTV